MKPRLEILVGEDGNVDVRFMAMNDREEKSVLDVYGRIADLVTGVELV